MMTGFVEVNGKPEILKDPNADLDYTIDFTAWLPSGDTIASVIWTKTGGLVLGTPQMNPLGPVTTRVSGGNAGEKCSLSAKVTTVQGRVDERTVYLKIRER
jgi:hypothetical protein